MYLQTKLNSGQQWNCLLKWATFTWNKTVNKISGNDSANGGDERTFVYVNGYMSRFHLHLTAISNCFIFSHFYSIHFVDVPQLVCALSINGEEEDELK